MIFRGLEEVKMDKVSKQLEIPVKCGCDVVVVGGGPAGFCAAVAAARNGANTVLVEQNGCGGGMATAGLVGPFMTSYNKSGDKMIIRGMFEEVIDRLVAQGGAIHPEECRAGDPVSGYHFRGHDHCAPFDPEILKRVIDEMLTEANVRVLYHTSFVEPLVEDDTIKGIVIFSKNGMEMIRAKIVIDCSGDADVAYRAGVPCELGDEAHGRIQPSTMFFRIGNVEWEKVDAEAQANMYRNRVVVDGSDRGVFHWKIEEAKKNGDFNINRWTVGIYQSVKKDEWNVNISRIADIDGTSAEDLSRAEMIGRRQVDEIFRFLKKYIPGCENAKLLSSASTIGIRESRHIKGEATLTADDVLNGTVPEDVILLASNSIDVHGGAGGAAGTKYVTIENGEWYGVSFRSLVPVKVDQLLVAGRSLSATSEGAGAVRVMPPCMEMGHAAGVAAAMAVKEGCLVRNVDVKAVQAQMVKEGSFLG